VIHALDGETFLITRSMPAPQSVCWAHDIGDGSPKLYLPQDVYPIVRKILTSGDMLVNHNITFDAAILCVESPDLLPLFFEGFSSGQIRCTMIREQLIRIARGEGRFVVEAEGEDADEDAKQTRTRFDLASCSWRWLKHFVKKQDTWRLRYRELYGIPLEEWPEEARTYPLTDAVITRRVFLAQQQFIDATWKELPDEIPQHRYAWALKLVQLWGVRTEKEVVSKLKEQLTTAQSEAIAKLLPLGIFREGGTKANPKFVKTTKVIRERVLTAYQDHGDQPPLTKKGFISTATKTLRESGDKHLIRLADASVAMKLLSSFVPVLESGVDAPICADYNVLVESGRTSCRKPNMQQLPRGTKEYQPRESFIARPGKAWVSVDYEMAELVGQGQMLLDTVGHSVLADQIRSGKKPILAFAAKLLGKTYEETVELYAQEDKTVKKRRQDSKAAMYGLPGGMRAKRLWQSMIAFGAEITLDEAKQLEQAWRDEYSEFLEFFEFVKRQIGFEYGATGTIVQLRSGRIRGGCDFPAACNTYFQGLISECGKSALESAVYECYMVPTSLLFGSRIVVFAHDELIAECDIDRVHEVGYRLAEIMKSEAKKWIPDVPMEAEPAAMLRWYKGAPTVKVGGRLVPFVKDIKCTL
jgi:DNA polymerase-1